MAKNRNVTLQGRGSSQWDKEGMATPPNTDAHGEHGGMASGTAPHDKVCVRGLVLPARIGIWSEEQGIAQRVRFTVELSVSEGGHRPGDLSSVVSYDFIIDAIKEAVAGGHVLLTETLAESVAARCLSHNRAVEVRVVVEKLDRIPGAALGCEIVRSKGT